MPQLQPPPNLPPSSVVFDKFDGLKNTLQPERLGPRDLVRARNVTLDDSGQLSRRRGFTKRVSGNAHSLFTTVTGSPTLAVLNGSLGVLNPDYSFTAMRSGIGSDPSTGAAPLSYAQVGPSVYYSGPTDSGIVDLNVRTVGPWGSATDLFLSPVVNPTATLPAIAGKLLGKPPNATALAYFNGRIYLAEGRVLWWTELFLYNYVNKTKTFAMFEADITMIGAVGDGIYVGTTEGLWFLSPKQVKFGEPMEMGRVRVMDSPVIPGSMVMIPNELANPPQTGLDADTPLQVSLSFMTTNGFCVAQDGGQTLNLTEGKFFFPAAQSAAAMFRRQDGMNQYITSMQSGGDPQNNAAIGDYIDVTIIRASAAATPLANLTGG